MTSLIPVDTVDDILPRYLGTPIERLFRYHNLKESLPPGSGRAELLVGMCMDHRKDLVMPKEFAYVLRRAGGNLRDSGFEISFAVGVGGISAIALLAHTDCGMAYVSAKREVFVRGLVERGGWDGAAALEQFMDYASHHDIGDPLEFVVVEAARLRKLYPTLVIAPMLYMVENDRLLQIAEQ